VAYREELDLREDLVLGHCLEDLGRADQTRQCRGQGRGEDARDDQRALAVQAR